MSPLPPGFIDEASRWIGFDTVTDRSNAPLIDRASRLLAACGWQARRQKVVERGVSFYNLLARRGPSAGRPLLFNTHTDTVPPGPHDRWTSTGGDPFRLTRRGGFLHGLGVADVKLNLLCLVQAARAFSGAAFRKPVVIAATYGEERGLRGARALIGAWRGPKPALVVDGEPTEMALIHRHRGYLVFEWTLPEGPLLRGGGRAPGYEVLLRGKSAHSSTPDLGVNALERGERLLAALTRAGFSPRLLSLEGGTAHNQVPAEARLRFLCPGWPPSLRLKDAAVRRVSFPLARPVRLVPWELLSRLGNFSASLPASCSLNWAIFRREGGKWKARFDLRFPPELEAGPLISAAEKALAGRGALRVLLNDPPLDLPRAAPPLVFLKKVLRRSGLPVTLREKPTCTEAGLYDAWGAPAVVVGPGRSTGNIHRPNERIALGQLSAAVRFYEELLRAWTS